MVNDESIEIVREKFKDAEVALRNIAESLRGARSAEERFKEGREKLNATSASVEVAAKGLSEISGQLRSLLTAFDDVVVELRKADSESLRKDVAKMFGELGALSQAIREGALTAQISDSVRSLDQRVTALIGRIEGGRPVAEAEGAVREDLSKIAGTLSSVTKDLREGNLTADVRDGIAKLDQRFVSLQRHVEDDRRVADAETEIKYSLTNLQGNLSSSIKDGMDDTHQKILRALVPIADSALLARKWAQIGFVAVLIVGIITIGVMLARK